MCPLVVAPNRGYADYQRVDNYDTGVLWNNPGVLSNATVVSPVLDVSRFGYLGGTVAVAAGTQANVAVSWFADAGITVVLGQRTFALQNTGAAPAQIRFPNLGPYCRFTVTSATGAAFNFTATIIATNRLHPLEMIPTASSLFAASGKALAIGGTDTYFPASYCAGPVQLWIDTGGVSVELTILGALSNANSYVLWRNQSQTTLTTDIVIVPLGVWFAQVFNNAGAAVTYSIAATSSLTGAS